MAENKIIQVSPDNINWYSLPSPEASLSVTKATTDASVLGQTFVDNFPTIIDWEVTATGLVKGAAAYCGKILKQGAPTTVVDQPMTLVSGKTYRITNAAQNIWLYDETTVIEDNGVDVTDEVIEFNYLFGTVTFAPSYTVTGPVTASFTYTATTVIGRPLSFSLTQSATNVDDSDYNTVCANGGYRLNKQGQREVSLSFSGIYSPDEDFMLQLEDLEEFILEIDPLGDGLSVARGYFRVMEDGLSGAVGENEAEEIMFSLAVPSPDFAPFAWEHNTGTKINTAVRTVLNAWENETDMYVRYAPRGLDNMYKTGTVVVTDVSLESEIEGINRFNITLVGDGSITTVTP